MKYPEQGTITILRCNDRHLLDSFFTKTGVLRTTWNVYEGAFWGKIEDGFWKLYGSATLTAWKVSKYGFFSGPYFPVIGLNTEICGVNHRIQSKYGKIRTRKNSVFGQFSRSEYFFYDSKFKQNQRFLER